MSRMPAAELRRALSEFVAQTEKHRDAAAAEAEKARTAGGRESALGVWSGYALSLSSLHTWTDGEFGTPYQEQPSPFTELASREGVTR